MRNLTGMSYLIANPKERLLSYLVGENLVASSKQRILR
jgi:hypothetical protein